LPAHIFIITPEFISLFAELSGEVLLAASENVSKGQLENVFGQNN
jgi:hypothetical protein